jgi:hypothetical protein
MSLQLSTAITAAVLDKVIGLLVPLFMITAEDDVFAARHAASRLLAAYNAETEEELRLAAEIIGFGFGALDALSRSMADGLSANAVLRLRGSANSQHRSANQCQRTLDKLRKERRIPTTRSKDAPELELAEPATAETLKLSDLATAVTPSRQQRRAAERKTEKTLRKQAELDRREAMRKTRNAAYNPAVLARSDDQPRAA